MSRGFDHRFRFGSKAVVVRWWPVCQLRARNGHEELLESLDLWNEEEGQTQNQVDRKELHALQPI